MKEIKHPFSKHLIVILKEMCKRVSADYEKIDFMKDGWFWKYKWTKDGESKFEEWLTDYVYNNPDARTGLTTINYKSKKHCKVFALNFIWNYGWKLKEESE